GGGDRFILLGAPGTAAVLTPGAVTGSETVQVAGNAITLTGVELQWATGLQALRLTTAGGNDVFTVTSAAPGQNQIAGPALAPLAFSGVRDLAIDLGARDPAGRTNSLTVTGPWRASGLKNVTVTGGAGADRVTLTTTSL